jgi:group I intron endonuclease
METYGQIYKITNKLDCKPYIGQTTEDDINDRWKKYKKLQCKRQPKLYNALKAHGPENFLFEVIDTTPQDQSQLDNLEISYVSKFDSMNNGYNCTPGGKGIGKGHIVSKETRKKISEKLKGRRLSEETKQVLSNMRMGDKNPMFGKYISEEHKGKISRANIGRLVSEETKRKISETSKNRICLPETRERMSISRQGRQPNLGNHHSIEVKTKISKALTGRVLSEETKLRMSIAAKNRQPKSQ